MMLFLSQGTTYDQFLLSYSSTAQRKSHFPYEKVTSFEVLNTGFPQYSDFYSTLKGHNTLEAGYLQYQALLNEGMSEREALSKMSLKKPLLTGEEEYRNLCEEFYDRGYTKLADLLMAYNIQDVEPMVDGIQNLYEFYEFRCEYSKTKHHSSRRSEDFDLPYGERIKRGFFLIPPERCCALQTAQSRYNRRSEFDLSSFSGRGAYLH